MITLSFHHPVRGEAPVLIRGACFRIGADGTLRGPQNDVVARYHNALWRLPHGDHWAFECQGPVVIRIVDSAGHSVCSGPYQMVKVADGAIFTEEGRLAVKDFRSAPGSQKDVSLEVVILAGV